MRTLNRARTWTSSATFRWHEECMSFYQQVAQSPHSHGEHDLGRGITTSRKGSQMNTARQTIHLPDNRELIIRQPETEMDGEKMIAFFAQLPRELRNYLRYNVMNPELFRERLKMVDGRNHWRLIAEIDGVVIGDGTMDREPFGWTHHVAHVRTVVCPQSLHLGIGTILLRCLVEIGRSSGIDRFYSEVIKEHKEMIRNLREEGFVDEAVLRDYAKDLKGRLHDVVVMSNDQSAVWNRLEEHIDALDIKMTSIHRGA